MHPLKTINLCSQELVMNLVRLCQAALFCATILWAAMPACGSEPLLDVTLTVDFAIDTGQNRGSLFEAYDREGGVVAGAGFLGAYNTQPRSNRRRLHFFLKPKSAEGSWTQLPRVHEHTGVYLSDQEGKLLARSRSGRNSDFYALDTSAGEWRRDDSISGYDVDVGGKPLRVREQTVTYDEQTILTVSGSTRIRENYYALGQLVLRLQDDVENSEKTSNRLVAVPWSGGESSPASLQAPHAVQLLRSQGEFVYALGQLHDEILAATNTGGVYVWKDHAWRVLVEPGPHSYQVYSMLNYYDRLLLGHYPSGELFEYDGQELRQLSGWPPVMPGVSSRAREAQTLAIYGGDLYAGVWPWAEVWRYERNPAQWQFVRRMFRHPEPTSATVHPYEQETVATGAVLNQWGQRVTSLVPFADSLYVSTSSKSGLETPPRPSFLSEEQFAEFGRVHQLQLPGQLSAELAWTEGPTTIRCLLNEERMSLWQDGELRAETAVRARDICPTMPDRLAWGRGIYGTLVGSLLARRSNLDRPFLGAYVNFDRAIAGARTDSEREAALDALLDRFQASGLRVVMPYVTTTSGSAAYPSDVMPARLYGDWDPLAYLIAGAKRRRLEVYPVFCVLACGHEQPHGILAQHPQWAVRSPEGEPLGFISPAHPEARAWVVSVITEVVRNYAVDGILLDYLRYHNRPLRLDAESEAEFARFRQRHPERGEAELFKAFRESALTKLARQISSSVRALRPDVQIAMYSWGPHVASQHRVGQNWPLWSREGYVDMVNISGYCYPANYGDKYLEVFSRRIGDAVRLNRSQHGRAEVTFCLGVVTSHGQIETAGEVQEYLQRAAREEVSGVALFTWATLQPYLDEIIRSDYLPKFVEQMEANSAVEGR